MLNPQALASLTELGFIDHLPPPPHRCVYKIAGPEKAGKSHLALTGTPPIIYFSIDKGTEGVVEKFQANGKQVLVYEITYKDGLDKSVYEGIWKDFRERLDAALQVGEGTIVFDTFSEIYELIRYVRFGRILSVPPTQYPMVYPDLRKIVDDIYSTKMSAAFLTKMVPQYDNKTVLEERGFSEMGFRVQCSIQVSREDYNDTNTGAGQPVFKAFVKECRQNMMMTGMVLSSKNDDGQDRFNLEYTTQLIHTWRPNVNRVVG